jgi:hypothetical protein
VLFNQVTNPKIKNSTPMIIIGFIPVLLVDEIFEDEIVAINAK